MDGAPSQKISSSSLDSSPASLGGVSIIWPRSSLGEWKDHDTESNVLGIACIKYSVLEILIAILCKHRSGWVPCFSHHWSHPFCDKLKEVSNIPTRTQQEDLCDYRIQQVCSLFCWCEAFHNKYSNLEGPISHGSEALWIGCHHRCNLQLAKQHLVDNVW